MLTYQLSSLAKLTHASRSSSYPLMPSTNQPAPEAACLPIASRFGREWDWIWHERQLSESVAFLGRMCILGGWLGGFGEWCEQMKLGLRVS